MRALDRLIAMLAGLALVAAGGLLAVEAVLVAANRPAWLIPRHRWHQDLRVLAWDDRTIRASSVVMIALGALLLGAQLIPRRPLRFPLRGRTGRTAWLSRRGLQHHLERTASQDPDAATGRARVGRRRALIDVGVAPRADRRALAQRLDETGRRTVDQLGLVRPHEVRYRYRVAKARVR